MSVRACTWPDRVAGKAALPGTIVAWVLFATCALAQRVPNPGWQCPNGLPFEECKHTACGEKWLCLDDAGGDLGGESAIPELGWDDLVGSPGTPPATETAATSTADEATDDLSFLFDENSETASGCPPGGSFSGAATDASEMTGFTYGYDWPDPTGDFPDSDDSGPERSPFDVREWSYDPGTMTFYRLDDPSLRIDASSEFEDIDLMEYVRDGGEITIRRDGQTYDFGLSPGQVKDTIGQAGGLDRKLDSEDYAELLKISLEHDRGNSVIEGTISPSFDGPSLSADNSQDLYSLNQKLTEALCGQSSVQSLRDSETRFFVLEEREFWAAVGAASLYSDSMPDDGSAERLIDDAVWHSLNFGTSSGRTRSQWDNYNQSRSRAKAAGIQLVESGLRAVATWADYYYDSARGLVMRSYEDGNTVYRVFERHRQPDNTWSNWIYMEKDRARALLNNYQYGR